MNNSAMKYDIPCRVQHQGSWVSGHLSLVQFACPEQNWCPPPGHSPEGVVDLKPYLLLSAQQPLQGMTSFRWFDKAFTCCFRLYILRCSVSLKRCTLYSGIEACAVRLCDPCRKATDVQSAWLPASQGDAGSTIPAEYLSGVVSSRCPCISCVGYQVSADMR